MKKFMLDQAKSVTEDECINIYLKPYEAARGALDSSLSRAG